MASVDNENEEYDEDRDQEETPASALQPGCVLLLTPASHAPLPIHTYRPETHPGAPADTRNTEGLMEFYARLASDPRETVGEPCERTWWGSQGVRLS